jgi:hypothetical protein
MSRLSRIVPISRGNAVGKGKKEMKGEDRGIGSSRINFKRYAR